MNLETSPHFATDRTTQFVAGLVIGMLLVAIVWGTAGTIDNNRMHRRACRAELAAAVTPQDTVRVYRRDQWCVEGYPPRHVPGGP